MASKSNRAAAAAGGELSGLLRKAEELHRELERAEGTLRDVEVAGTDAAHRVRVTLAADGSSCRVELIDDAAASLDAPAMREAMEQALKVTLSRLFEARRERLGEVSRGLHLPGLFQ